MGELKKSGRSFHMSVSETTRNKAGNKDIVVADHRLCRQAFHKELMTYCRSDSLEGAAAVVSTLWTREASDLRHSLKIPYLFSNPCTLDIP